MSHWHRDNPEVPEDRQPFAWMRSLRSSPQKTAEHTPLVLCDECAPSGRYVYKPCPWHAEAVKP